MAPKTNLDYYNELLDEIELHFGLDWLRSEAGKAHSRHWVPRAWARASEILLNAAQTKVADFSEVQVVALFDLASDLRVASALPAE